jgi:hypothetical membrane protein
MIRADSNWQFGDRSTLCGFIAALGILQFLGAVIYTARVYPGGYEITEYFLSDLGRMRTPAGLDNSFCARVFNWSVILLGISLLPSFAVMAAWPVEGQLVPGISGLVSCLGLMGIGATPYDVHLSEHLLALAVWFFSTLLLVISFFRAADLSRWASILLGVVTSCIVAAAWKYGAAQQHSDRVVYQKILVATCVGWFVYVLFIICISKVRSLPSHRERQERLAAAYLSKLEREHRMTVNPSHQSSQRTKR